MHALLLAIAAALHPSSFSAALVDIDGSTAELRVVCDLDDLTQVVAGLDADGDGSVSEAELGVRQLDVAFYVGSHFDLTVGTDRDESGGEQLPSTPVAAEYRAPGAWNGIDFPAGATEVRVLYTHRDDIADVLVEMRLFEEVMDDHTSLVTVRWPDGSTALDGLDSLRPRLRVDPTGRGAFATFLRLGFEHILGGWDHLAFVAALTLSAWRWRTLIAVLTGFTVAHSITLALAAGGVVDTARHGYLIETGIALSIVYLAVDQLVHRRDKRARWLESTGFGLLHGLGFAGFVGASLADEPGQLTALFAFNLGVEAGQLLAVAVLAVPMMLLARRERDGDSFLAPTWLRTTGCLAIAALGTYWFVERV